VVTLPATQDTLFDVPTISPDMPLENILRAAAQRVVEGEPLSEDARRALHFMLGRALQTPAPARVGTLHAPKPDLLSDLRPNALVKPKIVEGYYRWEGKFVKVQQNQAGTNLYAKLWDGEAWEYTPRLVGQLSPGMKLSAEDAKEFGALYGRCVFCSQQLNDERSIAAGYGEICASNHGLPWG